MTFDQNFAFDSGAAFLLLPDSVLYFALAWRNSRQCFACDDDARFDRDDYLAVSDSRWSRRGRTQFFDGVLNVYFRSWKIGFSDAFVACGHLLPRNFCWNRCLGSQA